MRYRASHPKRAAGQTTTWLGVWDGLLWIPLFTVLLFSQLHHFCSVPVWLGPCAYLLAFAFAFAGPRRRVTIDRAAGEIRVRHQGLFAREGARVIAFDA